MVERLNERKTVESKYNTRADYMYCTALMSLNNANIIIVNYIIIGKLIIMYVQDIKNLFTRLIALSLSWTQPVREWVVSGGSDY